MSATNDGGSIAPNMIHRTQYGNHIESMITLEADGCLSMRDWFAGMAITGTIDACQFDMLNNGETIQQMFARKAYALADAMLAAREAKEEGQ